MVRFTARLNMTLVVSTGPLILRAKQNKWIMAITDSDITLSGDHLSQKIIKNMPRKD